MVSSVDHRNNAETVVINDLITVDWTEFFTYNSVFILVLVVAELCQHLGRIFRILGLVTQKYTGMALFSLEAGNSMKPVKHVFDLGLDSALVLS